MTQAETMSGIGQTALVTPKATGRRLIQFRSEIGAGQATKMLSRATDGGEVYRAEASLGAAPSGSGSVLVERFNIAAIDGSRQSVLTAANILADMDEVIETRPEFWLYAVEGPPWLDQAEHTWGLDASGAVRSSYDGSDIRLAILDTGLDLEHPDFSGRDIVTRSFVDGEPAQDVQGHGTHCAGTAAGRRQGGNVPRYGVAPNASLFIGKVLNNRGAGRELDIMAGMAWAIDEGCQVISMSLGRDVSEEEAFDPIYEEIAARALEAGCLIVAASGNASDRRYNYVAPVGSPANAPSILAVAAIGADGKVAGFSSGGSGKAAVDVAGPGVGIFSSFPQPQSYRKLQGTSMACPHVAGLAALWAQSDPSLRGRQLWEKLIESTVAVETESAIDIGAGLVIAP